jgi:hypothetical protein
MTYSLGINFGTTVRCVGRFRGCWAHGGGEFLFTARPNLIPAKTETLP